MKKKSIVLTLLVGALVYCVTAQAETTLATFEVAGEILDNPIVGSVDDSTTFAVVDNPDKTGANTTNKCLLDRRPEGCSWTVGDRIFSSTGDSVLATADNRYLHILVYSPDAASGHVILRVLPDNDGMWDNDNQNENVRFDFSAGKWKDVVIDLEALKSKFRDVGTFNAVYGIYFLSQDWSGAPSERNFYYDEIIVDNNSLPRGLLTVTTATVLEDFETAGAISDFAMDGSALANIEVTDNPEKNTVNASNKVLHGKTIATGGDWWAGVRINFAEPYVQITDATRFLHVLLKTTLVKYRFVIFHQSGETYTEEIVPRAANDWFDQIVDLYSIGGGLQDKLIYGIRLVAMVDNDDNQGKDFYLDQIAVNGDGGYIVDATLSAITVNGTAISGFSPTSYSYTVTVPATATSVAIAATLSNPNATLDGTNIGTKNLTGDVTPFTIKVTAENTLDTATYTLQIALEEEVPAAVLVTTAGNLSVYPNPTTNGQLIVAHEKWDANDKVEVYNLQGVLLGVYATANISISHLPAGTYIVKVGNKTAKVLKQ